MKTIEHSLDIPAPVARVWALTIDVESWPSVTPKTVTAVERLDDAPLRVGSKTRIKQPAQPTREWTVTELAEEQRFVWSTRARGYSMTARHTLEDLGGATRNRLAIDLDGPLSSVIALLAGRSIRKTIATENECFGRAATV